MNIVSTHFKILRCLHHEVYTINDLSFILGIPEFKVRKYIHDLEYLLKSNGNLEIHEAVNKDCFEIDKLKNMQSFLPDERQSYIVLSFLYSNMLQLTKLSEELNVSRRTISNDLIELKEFLSQFSLEIESLNFQGIVLNGLETNKRKVFELFLLKNMNNAKYLPTKLKNLILSVRDLCRTKEIIPLINELTVNMESSLNGLGLSHLELLISIASIRKEYSGLCSSEENLITENSGYEKYELIFTNLSYLSNYEKNMLIKYLESRKYLHIASHEKNTFIQIQKLLEIINAKFSTKIKLDINLFMRLYGIFKCYQFKQQVGFNNFYLFNKNLSEEYLDIFKKLKKILQKRFPNIDSYEMIFMSSIFIVEIQKDMKRKLKKLEKTIIVYNSLNILTLKELCYELEIDKIISDDNFVYINHLNEYVKENDVAHTITFEDIYITDQNISKLRLLLPITQADKLKIKGIFKM